MKLPYGLPADATAGNELAGQQVDTQPPMIYDAVVKYSQGLQAHFLGFRASRHSTRKRPSRSN